jgi:hypothetical protein
MAAVYGAGGVLAAALIAELVIRVRRRRLSTDWLLLIRTGHWEIEQSFCFSHIAKRAELFAPPPDILPVVTTIIMVAPIMAPRVVPVGVVATTIVIGPPPAPVGTANPMYLLHTRNSVCGDWCDWHCRCGRRCKAATKCRGRKNQFDVGHGHSSVDAPLTRDTAGSFWPDLVNQLNFYSDNQTFW